MFHRFTLYSSFVLLGAVLIAAIQPPPKPPRPTWNEMLDRAVKETPRGEVGMLSAFCVEIDGYTTLTAAQRSNAKTHVVGLAAASTDLRGALLGMTAAEKGVFKLLVTRRILATAGAYNDAATKLQDDLTTATE